MYVRYFNFHQHSAETTEPTDLLLNMTTFFLQKERIREQITNSSAPEQDIFVEGEEK